MTTATPPPGGAGIAPAAETPGRIPTRRMDSSMTLPIPAGTYDIDPMHSQLTFAVKHLGISTVRGTFDAFSGSLTVGESLADTSISIDVEMSSINSGNAMRDGHVQGDEFFDVANHSHMTFRSTSISEDGENYALTGDLTIKGVTQPVTFTTTYNGEGIFPMDQSTHFGFTGSATISRSAFGVTYGVPMVSDDVAINLDVQFVRPAA